MEAALRSLLEVCDEGGLGGGDFGVRGAGAKEGCGDFAVGGEVLTAMVSRVFVALSV